MKHCATKKLRTRQFLIEYSAALKQQDQDGTHILVYMDESYVHQRHSANYTWASPSDPVVHSGSGKGNRLIIVHAISRDGLLFCDGHNRQKGEPFNFIFDLRHFLPSASVYFRARNLSAYGLVKVSFTATFDPFPFHISSLCRHRDRHDEAHVWMGVSWAGEEGRLSLQHEWQ